MRTGFTLRFIALALAAILLGLTAPAQSTTLIATVAGGGDSGPPGGAPLSVGLDAPSDLAFDGVGRLVVMSSGFSAHVACWVARLAADGSLVSRVAGDGSCGGYSGDGGPATSAAISGDTVSNLYPGLAVDGAGNIYIADLTNHRVRKVDAATGIISTMAGTGTAGFSGDGGAATAAQLSYPSRVAVDASGNLYIAAGHRIRKVAAATGLISTLAGTGTVGFSGDGGPATAAALNFPMGMALGASGDLYFADMNNARIRKVDAATGTITTVAGTGTWSYSGDGGAATAAQLSWPTGIAVDAAGNLYIADNQNSRVRKVDAASGNIATLMGTGGPATPILSMPAASAPLATPVGLALGGGKLYFADMSKNFLNQLNLSTGLVDTVAGTGVFGSGGDGGLATAAQFAAPSGVVRDAQGNLYVADTYGNRVRKLDAASGLISTVAGTGTQGLSGDGGAATAAMLNRPGGLSLDAAGNLYIADFYNDRVRKLDAASGIISTVAGTTQGFSGDGGLATAAKLKMPASLAFDASGQLYIADMGNCRIRRVDVATGNIDTVAGNGVCTFSGDGGLAMAVQLLYPRGIAFDGAGNLYIADTQNHRIRKVDVASGIITTHAGTGTAGFGGDGGAATAAQLKSPTDMAFDAAGILYVVDGGNRRLRRIADTPDAATAVVAVVGDGLATVSFTAPAYAGSTSLSGYTVVSSPAGGVDAQAGTTALSHTITGLTNGSSYTFTVVASNSIGAGPDSAASSAVTPVTNPGAPTGAAATAGNAQATVTFTAPVANGGSAITGYTVVSSPAGGVDSNAGSTGLSHTITGLANGTSYTFTVVATNAIGTSPASAASGSVTPSAPVIPAPSYNPGPSAPTTTTVAPGGSATLGSLPVISQGGATVTVPKDASGGKVTLQSGGAPTSLVLGEAKLSATPVGGTASFSVQAATYQGKPVLVISVTSGSASFTVPAGITFLSLEGATTSAGTQGAEVTVQDGKLVISGGNITLNADGNAFAAEATLTAYAGEIVEKDANGKLRVRVGSLSGNDGAVGDPFKATVGLPATVNLGGKLGRLGNSSPLDLLGTLVKTPIQQNPDGTLGSVIHGLPVSLRIEAGRADDVQGFELANNGLVIRVLPLPADINAFTKQSATSLTMDGDGILHVSRGQNQYARRAAYLTVPTTAADSFNTDAQGNLVWANNGSAQTIYPAFGQPEKLKAALLSLDPKATLTDSADGNYSATLKGQRYQFRPDFELLNFFTFPAAHRDDAWWVEGSKVFINYGNVTAQGFAVK